MKKRAAGKGNLPSSVCKALGKKEGTLQSWTPRTVGIAKKIFARAKRARKFFFRRGITKKAVGINKNKLEKGLSKMPPARIMSAGFTLPNI